MQDKAFIANLIRVIVFVLAWLNNWLVSKGAHPLPVISDSQAAFAIAFIASVWTMVRENPFKRQKVPAAEEPPTK